MILDHNTPNWLMGKTEEGVIIFMYHKVNRTHIINQHTTTEVLRAIAKAIDNEERKDEIRS